MKPFVLGGMIVAASLLPHTSTYQLNSYGFGSGGAANTHTTTYSLEGSSGQFTGAVASTSTKSSNTNPGFTQTQQANVPKIKTLDNNNNVYYNQLHFVIDTQSNPSTATYLISVSTTSNFSSVSYVQPDGTLSSTKALADYQTYAAWGGATGSLITGLQQNQIYYVRARATQGSRTESADGPANSATTAAESITFSLATSTQSSPPYSINFGTLPVNVVTPSPQTINTAITTNGASGANVYIKSQNGGLYSASTGKKISGVTNDLSTLSEGFGAQNTSVGQTSGGPYTVVSPYNVTGNNVAAVGTGFQSLYTSSTPITGGTGRLTLDAKASTTDVAANDYQEIITFVAAASF